VDNKNIFARNLKYYMALNNKTRRDLEAALGVSYYTISDWVNGKKYPRMDKVELLANYFNIQKSDLIEEQITEEIEKDNDTLSSIIVRLRTDKKFSDVVEAIYNMDPSKIDGVKQMLDTLEAFGK
jgi:transcriptional regulator with XRE-family HTH domain